MKTLATLAVVLLAATRVHAQPADDSVELTTEDEVAVEAAPGVAQPAPEAAPGVAQPAPVDPALDDMTKLARNLSRDGHCDALLAIGARVRTRDAAYFANVFAADPTIAACHVAPAPVPVAPYADDEPVGGGPHRSPGVALALSGGTFLAGVVLLGTADGSSSGPILAGLAAVTVGPTLGHIYAGQAWNKGLKIRLISAGVGLAGATLAVAACPPFSRCESEGAAMVGVLAFGLASIGYTAGTIYEIGDAPGAAQRFNTRHQLAVVPAAAGSPGLTVAGSF